MWIKKEIRFEPGCSLSEIFLIAHHNKIQDLHNDIFSGTNLHYLDSSYNQFAEIEFLEQTGTHALKTLILSIISILEILVEQHSRNSIS